MEKNGHKPAADWLHAGQQPVSLFHCLAVFDNRAFICPEAYFLCILVQAFRKNRIPVRYGCLFCHISHCIVHAVEHGDKSAVEDLNRAIDQFVK